jgi:hypothetical protein
MQRKRARIQAQQCHSTTNDTALYATKKSKNPSSAILSLRANKNPSIAVQFTLHAKKKSQESIQ